MDKNEFECEKHKSTINYFCINEQCKQVRVGCFQCIQIDHLSHFKDTKEFKPVKQEMENCAKSIETIIGKIDDFFNTGFGCLRKLKKSLQMTQILYSRFPLELSLAELKYTIDHFVKHQNGRYQKILINIDSYIKELKQKLSQGQSLLNYQQFVEDELKDQAQSKIKNKEKELQIKKQQIITLGQQKKWKEQLTLIKEVLNTNSNDEQLLYQLANCYNALGQPKQAISIYDKILLKNPHLLQIQECRISSYIMDKNYDKALDSCGRLLQMDPTNSSILLFKGQCLWHKGELAEAFIFFSQLDKMIYNAEVKYRLGLILTSLGDKENAIKYFNEALELCHEKSEEIQIKMTELY